MALKANQGDDLNARSLISLRQTSFLSVIVTVKIVPGPFPAPVRHWLLLPVFFAICRYLPLKMAINLSATWNLVIPLIPQIALPGASFGSQSDRDGCG